MLIGLLPYYHIYGLYVINLLSLHQGLKVVSMPTFKPEDYIRIVRENEVSVRERGNRVRDV